MICSYFKITARNNLSQDKICDIPYSSSLQKLINLHTIIYININGRESQNPFKAFGLINQTTTNLFYQKMSSVLGVLTYKGESKGCPDKKHLAHDKWKQKISCLKEILNFSFSLNLYMPSCLNAIGQKVWG